MRLKHIDCVRPTTLLRLFTCAWHLAAARVASRIAVAETRRFMASELPMPARRGTRRDGLGPERRAVFVRDLLRDEQGLEIRRSAARLHHRADHRPGLAAGHGALTLETPRATKAVQKVSLSSSSSSDVGLSVSAFGAAIPDLD